MKALALLLGFGVGCDVYDSSLLSGGGDAGDVAPEACPMMCNNQCVNTQTDQNNCGACGTTCEVGCVGGLCMPTGLASSLGAPHGIVVNSSSLYVAESGGINVFVMSKLDGTGLKNFATGMIAPDRLATDGVNTLFWTDDANIPTGGNVADPGGAVWEEAFVPPTTDCGGPYCYYARDLPSPYAIAVHGTTMFFTTLDPMNNSGNGCATSAWASSVLSSPLTGCVVNGCATAGGPTVIASGQTQLASIAVDATNIYWADSGAHVVRFCPQPTCTGGPQTFASNLGTPFDVVSNGTTVFFTDRSAGTLYACPTTGCGTTPTVLASGLTDPLLIAVDTKSVYVTLYAQGAIASCLLPSCAGGATTLATNLKAPYGIVSDSTYIYWTEEGSSGATSTDGSVSKLKIP